MDGLDVGQEYMRQKLSPDQMALYRRVDEILTYVWDPIGVREEPQARDEYQSYLPQVFKRVAEATSPEMVAEYLLIIVVESMGFTPNDEAREDALRIARLLIKHRDWIAQVHPDR